MYRFNRIYEKKFIKVKSKKYYEGFNTIKEQTISSILMAVYTAFLTIL